MAYITVVIPVHDEAGCLETLFERLMSVEAAGAHRYEYILVDDGSTDDSRAVIGRLEEREGGIKLAQGEKTGELARFRRDEITRLFEEV